MDKSRTKNTFYNTLLGWLNKIVNIFLVFVMRTVIIHILGAEYLGLDSLFTSILQMLNMTELGFSSAIVFSMYRPVAERDTVQICMLLAFYRKAYKVIGLVIGGIGLLLTPVLPFLVKGDIPGGLNLYILYLFYLLNTITGYGLFAYRKVLMNVHQKEGINNSINTAVVLSKCLLQVIVLILTKNFYFYLAIYALSAVGENICVLIISTKLYPQYVPEGELDKASKKEITKGIKGLLVEKICSVSRHSMDNIIISAFMGLTVVAVYGNYFYILSGVQFFLYCIANAMQAGIGNTIATENIEKNYKDMLKFDFMYMWLGSICSICLLCLYQPFIKLWLGEEFLLPQYIVILLVLQFYTLCIGDIRGLYYTGAGLWWEGRYKSILEAASNVALNVILGKVWGLTGIIAATIFSIVVINFGYGSTIVHRFYFKQKTGKYIKHHLFYAFATLCIAAICFEICARIPYGGILNLLLTGLCCVILGNGCLWLIYHKTDLFKESMKFIGGIFQAAVHSRNAY